MKTPTFKLLIYLLNIAFCMCYLNGSGQNVQNSDFENWHSIPNTFGGEDPDGWSSSNAYSAGANRKVIYKNNAAYIGNFSVEIMPLISSGTSSLQSVLCNGEAPGSYITMALDYRKGGTPISYKPVKLRGYYTYDPVTTDKDSAYAIVLLKKFNGTTQKAETVGKGSFVFSAATSYKTFEVEIADSMVGVKPDSIVIAFIYQSYCSGSRAQGKDLIVDDLSLVHNSGIEYPVYAERDLSIYPTLLHIGNILNLSSDNTYTNLTFSVYDLTGREIMAQNISVLSFNQPAYISALSTKGLYLYRISDHNNIILKSGRFIIPD